MSKKEKRAFESSMGDPYMVWKDTRICHDCLNRLQKGRWCDVLEDIEDVNEAIRSGKCEFYLKRECEFHFDTQNKKGE